MYEGTNYEYKILKRMSHTINGPEKNIFDTIRLIPNCKCNKNNRLCKIKIDYSRNNLLTQEAINIIRKSYLYNGDIQDLFSKLALEYSTDCQHAQIMYELFSKLIFIPSTPIIRSINKIDKHPISCFTNKLFKFDINSYLSKFKDMCLQLYGGGGSSINISDIGYIHDNNGGLYSNGINNFIIALEGLHELTRKQIPRKSSIAYYLDVSHPDIFNFVNIRKATFDLNKINISAQTNIAVIISDEFMDCVKQNKNWNLINPEDKSIKQVVNARELWIEIIKSRFETGEPFIYFEGNAEKYKSETYKKLNMPIGVSNLCTEIFIPTGIDIDGFDRNGVCCLGALNLLNFFIFDTESKYEIIKKCMLFLNNVLDSFIENSSDDEISDATVRTVKMGRPIGLGVMGYHSLLQEKNIPFDSENALQFSNELFKFIKQSADRASIELGEELGDCPDNIRAGIKGRFSVKIAIAPTSHISQLAGVSPGINPIVSNYYQLKGSSSNNIYINQQLLKIIDKKYLKYKEIILKHMLNNNGSIQGCDFIDLNTKLVFKTAYEICQKTYIKISGDRTKILSGEQGQSINLFFHKNIKFGEIMKCHMYAYECGIKTLYYLHNMPEMSSNNNSDICFSCI